MAERVLPAWMSSGARGGRKKAPAAAGPRKAKAPAKKQRAEKAATDSEEDEAPLSSSESSSESEERFAQRRTKASAARGGPRIPSAVVSKAKCPTSFEVQSGVLLWGHMQCVLDGAESRTFDLRSGAQNVGVHGGTVRTGKHQFRAAARNGTWIVARAFVRNRFTGFVVHHEGVAGIDLLRRCAASSFANGAAHDANIAEVGRYDWSIAYGTVDAVSAALQRHADNEDGVDEYASELISCCLFALDATHVDSLCATLARRKPKLDSTHTFASAESRRTFGVCAVGVFTEYELGWLVYSGKKHAVHTEADELVGIVYDSQYSALEGAPNGLRVEEEELHIV